MRRRRSESGQIIVIIALMIVAILGVTALAIDGSRVYSDRRSSQSAADSAALAGAGAAAEYIKNFMPSEFYCGSAPGAEASTKAIQAAINNASKDHFTVSSDPDAPSHVKVECDSDGYRQYLDITVQITTTTALKFAQVLRSQPLMSVTQTVTRVYPQQNLAFGNAIASLGTDCTTGGIDLSGNNTLKITDGGVFSNSCLSGKGNVELTVSGAEIQYVDTLTLTGSANFVPTATKASEILPEFTLDPPDCSSLVEKGAVTNGATIYPGIYTKIDLTGGNLVMKPGLYCLDGPFNIGGNASVNGTNVTIYMRSGGIDLDGTSAMFLSAPNCITSICGVPPAIRGILFYLGPTNTSEVNLTGTSYSDYTGTIYAPASKVVLNGTADQVTIETQIIGKRVVVTGNATLSLNLSGAELYQMPAYIELRR